MVSRRFFCFAASRLDGFVSWPAWLRPDHTKSLSNAGTPFFPWRLRRWQTFGCVHLILAHIFSVPCICADLTSLLHCFTRRAVHQLLFMLYRLLPPVTCTRRVLRLLLEVSISIICYCETRTFAIFCFFPQCCPLSCFFVLLFPDLSSHRIC